jgi:hypothetical protein
MSSSDKLIAALRSAPSSVKSLAIASGFSESRVRELLKTVPNLESNTLVKPVCYWIPDVTPEPVSQVEKNPPAHEGTDSNIVCPSCQAPVSDSTQATNRGDLINAVGAVCNNCGTIYNVFSGETIEAAPLAEKKRGSPINPQPKLDAFMAAMLEIGGAMEYERATRSWLFTTAKGKSIRLTSVELSTYKKFADFEPVLADIK